MSTCGNTNFVFTNFVFPQVELWPGIKQFGGTIMKQKIKEFLPFLLMLLVGIIVINAVLSFLPVSIKSWITDPVGSVKGLLTKAPASNAAAPAA